MGRPAAAVACRLTASDSTRTAANRGTRISTRVLCSASMAGVFPLLTVRRTRG